MSRHLPLISAILSVMALLASCSSSRRAIPVAVGDATPGRDLSTSIPPYTDGLHPHSKSLVSEARSWLGTPYKYGGEDHTGVDCSALVMKVYQSALDINVPRSSAEQHDYCASVSKSALIPGDLIFFATDKEKKSVSHVGIFIGEGKMIHASASKGVIVSDINQDYYVRNFAGAGYIERYHAMLGPVAPRGEKILPSPVKDVETASVEVSPEMPSATPTEPTALATASATATVEIPATQAATATASAPIIGTVTSTETANTAEPSVSDARAAVLNSIIEKEIR
ncbi:MAG: C40 family peptidase [Muribaculaceae bacterium]|nr:C40 family peptidase [Muribaculaceae bacterium]